eukprot:535493-Alexandrium_andersonii.AAC.1
MDVLDTQYGSVPARSALQASLHAQAALHASRNSKQSARVLFLDATDAFYRVARTTALAAWSISADVECMATLARLNQADLDTTAGKLRQLTRQ